MLAKAQRKTEASIDKLSEENRKVAEAQRKTEASLDKLSEAQRKTEASVDRTTKTVDALCKRVDKMAETIDKNQKASGVLAHIQGKIAEDLFFRNAVTQLRFRFIPVTNVTRNPFVFDREFDLVVHDGPRKTAWVSARRLDCTDRNQEPTDRR